MEPIVMPIEDVLDLHTFRPQEVLDLLEEYLAECLAAGFSTVRIVHGKGRGVLRERVHAFLKRHPRVVSFEDGPLDAGGWGATIVELKKR